MKIFFYCLVSALALYSSQDKQAFGAARKSSSAQQTYKSLPEHPLERSAVLTKVESDSDAPLQTLDLDQAIEAAKLRNPDYRAFQSRMGVSKAQILTAKGRLNPALLTDNGIAEKTYRLGVEQTFEIGGKRHYRVAVAKAQQDVMLAELGTELLNLRNSVRQAYTQLYNAKEKQLTYQNLLEVAQKLTKIAGEREKAGDISKLDVLQTEILSVNANNDLQYIIAEVTTAQSQLNALLNQPLETELNLTAPNKVTQIFPRAADASPPPFTSPFGHPHPYALKSYGWRIPRQGGGDKKSPKNAASLKFDTQSKNQELGYLVDLAFKSRPELRQNLGNQSVVINQLSLARANRIPNLMLTAGADLVTGSGSTQQLGAFIIGRMEMPLLNRQQGPIQEALARKIVLDRENDALHMKIRMQVNKALIAFQSNKARIERYESVLLPLSVTVMDKSRLAFYEGKTNVLMAINAQQAYMNTRLGYLQSLMDYQNAVGDLERTVGTAL